MSLTIRPATQDDLPTLAEIVIEGWRWGYKGIIPQQELDALDLGSRLRRMNDGWDPQRLFLVAADQETDHPVGLARAGSPPALPGYDAEIEAFYVHPGQTRSGVGKLLLSAMCERFAAQGAKTLCIHTLRANLIGRNFYEKHGGQVVAEDEWRGYRAVWYGWPSLPR